MSLANFLFLHALCGLISSLLFIAGRKIQCKTFDKFCIVDIGCTIAMFTLGLIGLIPALFWLFINRKPNKTIVIDKKASPYTNKPEVNYSIKSLLDAFPDDIRESVINNMRHKLIVNEIIDVPSTVNNKQNDSKN